VSRKREYLFRDIEEPVELTEGEDILRLICTGTIGDLDPINYIYMTRDLQLDPNTLEQDTSAYVTNRRKN